MTPRSRSKCVPLRSSVITPAKSSRDDVAKRLEDVLKLLVRRLEVNILDEDIGELSSLLLDLGLALFLADVMADEDLLVVEKHAVDSLDSGIGSVTGVVVDKAASHRSAGMTTISKKTYAKPRDFPVSSVPTLHERISPNAAKVS